MVGLWYLNRNDESAKDFVVRDINDLVGDCFTALYAAKLFDRLDTTHSKLKGMAIT